MTGDERFDSVWDAIEDTPAQAKTMRPRSSLMMALTEHISREGVRGDAAFCVGSDTGEDRIVWAGDHGGGRWVACGDAGGLSGSNVRG
jgi:hypothetical protein